MLKLFRDGVALYTLTAYATAAKLNTNLANLFEKNGGEPNADLVFPPLDSKSSDLATKMMVFIPGGNVATEYYTDTAKAIQEATNLNLWVVVPN